MSSVFCSFLIIVGIHYWSGKNTATTDGIQLCCAKFLRPSGTPRTLFLLLHRFIARCFGDYDQRCDVLQQVLIQLYLSLPDLRTDGTIQAWLFRVARNRCVDELRHRYVPNFSELATDENDEEVLISEGANMPSVSVEDVVEQLEEQRFLYQALSDLPQRYRVIVWLRYSTMLTFGEIGRMLQIPEATARTYFQRAKLLLRRSLVLVLD